MNIAISILGIVLVLGGFFGFGVLFVRWYDEWKQRKRERSEFWIEDIEKEKQRINVINELHEANKENYRKYEERIKELELQLASCIVLSKGVEIEKEKLYV